MRNIPILLILVIFLQPSILLADDLERHPLFKIERSKNANILQYDAQIRPDGTLDKKKPVVVYWVRLAEQGQIKKLSWIQRVFAYGFKTRQDPRSDSVSLDMAVDIGQPVKVQRVNGVYRATLTIDDRLMVLERIYIRTIENGLLTKVKSIELFGWGADDDEVMYERLEPCGKSSKSFCKPRTHTEGDR